MVQLLSIIISCHNEAPTLRMVVEEVLGVEIPLKREIIIVDDGSDDGSDEIAKKLEKECTEVRVLRNERRRGKGYCIRRALKVARGDVILIQDADGELRPTEYPKLLKPILEGGAKVVYGSRRPIKPASAIYHYGGKLNTWLFNFLFGTKLTDLNTGFKVFKREVLEQVSLREDGFGFCEEVTAKLARMGIEIIEVPVSYEPRKEKKLKWWRHAITSLRIMLRERLGL